MLNFTSVERGGSDKAASCPVIISASRSTDIPAYYSEWFIHRLRAGVIRWKNPFNQKDVYVNLQGVGGAVFWSKNPEPMLKYVDEIHNRCVDFYFQFTVNDYENEGFEPRVPPLYERVETFRRLSRKIGKERVIWRFDPICLTDTLSVDRVMDRLARIGDMLSGFTEQLVVSFVDVNAYLKVQRNIRNFKGAILREPTTQEQDELAGRISEYAQSRGLIASACGERRSFAHLGLKANRCIDGDLFAQICRPENVRLQQHLGVRVDQHSFLVPAKREVTLCKDKGQRKECGCVESKDIGMYNTCGHMCVYCYANASAALVEKNRAKHRVDDDGIIPRGEGHGGGGAE